jgi:hypothetical protein
MTERFARVSSTQLPTGVCHLGTVNFDGKPGRTGIIAVKYEILQLPSAESGARAGIPHYRDKGGAGAVSCDRRMRPTASVYCRRPIFSIIGDASDMGRARRGRSIAFSLL